MHEAPAKRESFRYKGDLIPKEKYLNPLVLRVLVPHQTRGGEMDPPSHLKNNNKCYEAETLGGVRSILQGLKNFQVDISAFVWLP